MSPNLHRVVLDGASRHRLNKGFILMREACDPVDISKRDQIISNVNRSLVERPGLAGFIVEARPTHPSLLGLATPFLNIYSVKHRDTFINHLAAATACLMQTAKLAGCQILAAGVNPYVQDGDGQPSALCADIHQIEVFDDGEIERIYNLYRQFLPELLAMSTHSSVYGCTIQKDFSLRMRNNQSSFLPRYISQFRAEHLAKLERVMRKDYGLADLRQMDVNPLAGEATLLNDAGFELLGPSSAAVELRFIDAQYSYPFIRAQMILFQAIAMYGRSLARQGRRLRYMRDEVIDENKVLAIQNGPSAVFNPDPGFKKGNGRRVYSYHDKGTPERANTALLMIINGLLLPALQDLDCQLSELDPIILGAELRQRGKRCLVNYAENQQYLYYTHPHKFVAVLKQQIEEHLTAPTLDSIRDFNKRTFPDLAKDIESEWLQKLTPQVRYKGHVKWYNRQEGYGFISPEEGSDIHVAREDIEGLHYLEGGQSVTFEIISNGWRPYASHVRLGHRQKQAGHIVRVDEAKGLGLIEEDSGDELIVHRSDVIGEQSLRIGDKVIFETILQEGEKGKHAACVQVQEQSHVKHKGYVKWYNCEKRYGFISKDIGEDIHVAQEDIIGLDHLEDGQPVTFEIVSRRGRQSAVYVCLEPPQKHTGQVVGMDEKKGFGFIRDDTGGDVFVHCSDVLDGASLQIGDLATFEITQQSSGKGPRAIHVRAQERPLMHGTVKWFDPKKHFGYISQSEEKDIFVHQSDLENAETLKPGQTVSFKIGQSSKGTKAIHVKVSNEG